MRRGRSRTHKPTNQGCSSGLPKTESRKLTPALRLRVHVVKDVVACITHVAVGASQHMTIGKQNLVDSVIVWNGSVIFAQWCIGKQGPPGEVA